MIALRIEIDDQPFVTAGVEDWVVLNAIVSGLRRAERDEPDHLEIHISGMAANAPADQGEHLRWGRQRLGIGSKVTVTVVEVDTADPPTARAPSDRAVTTPPFTPEERRRLRWKSYIDLKAEFEPDAT